MKREIKFRAWNTKSGRFAKDGELFLSIDSKNYNLYSVDFDNFRLENDNYILMQSTGLRDKNGVEVYEGDIVKVTDDNDEISELNSNTGIGAIEWLDKWGFWNISRIENSLGDINNSYDIEVIGNIYENPNYRREK